MSLIVLLNKLFFRLILPVSVVLVVASCTTTTVPPVEPSASAESKQYWQARQVELNAIKYWKLSGRMAVSQGDDAWNIDVEWAQKDQDYEIVLQGPFGLGKVKLTGNEYGVMLRDSDDQVFYSDKAETLLYDQTGVVMPVNGLRYWVVGLASPVQQIPPQIDQLGRLAFLEQDTWKVKFKRYTQVSGIHLPRKVFIVEANNHIDVRLVVDKWKLGAF